MPVERKQERIISSASEDLQTALYELKYYYYYY